MKKHDQDGKTKAPPVAEASAAPEESPGGALLEIPAEAVSRLESELAEAKDRHLRLAAEFDNFRKRIARERTETAVRAQAEVVVRLVDALDDLARFAHVDPAQTDAKALHEGVDMVERKFWKELGAIGLSRIDQVGAPFDPTIHEAVATTPATAPEQDHTVGAILQAGYKLGDSLVRPARVLVLTWTGDVPRAPEQVLH
ncbi:MAG TPA: nucleotide exchange factor GrpE [Gemmatimonadales bacterium]|nr:nucleotide exchange factor GrpE [Gemmatimonadales bacterium]